MLELISYRVPNSSAVSRLNQAAVEQIPYMLAVVDVIESSVEPALCQA
jgi:hypothetical protein